MFTKVIGFRKESAAILRSAYYVSRDVESHKDLDRLTRHCWGSGVGGPIDVLRFVVRAKVDAGRRRGGRRKYQYLEIIISSPEGADLAENEVTEFSWSVAEKLGAVAAILGIHWHENGRCDWHLLVPNYTASGASLARSLVLPSTGRRHRNVEVVAREVVEIEHKKLNAARKDSGRTHIPTMAEVMENSLDELVNEAEHMDEILAASEAWMAEADSSDEIGEVIDAAPPTETTQPVELPPTASADPREPIPASQAGPEAQEVVTTSPGEQVEDSGREEGSAAGNMRNEIRSTTKTWDVFVPDSFGTHGGQKQEAQTKSPQKDANPGRPGWEWEELVRLLSEIGSGKRAEEDEDDPKVARWLEGRRRLRPEVEEQLRSAAAVDPAAAEAWTSWQSYLEVIDQPEPEQSKDVER